MDPLIRVTLEMMSRVIVDELMDPIIAASEREDLQGEAVMELAHLVSVVNELEKVLQRATATLAYLKKAA